MSKIEDRELLELAAKAGGYRVGWFRKLPHQCLVLVDESGAPTNPRWNSLIDDGDCARLEEACEIDVTWFPGYVDARRWDAGGMPAVGVEQHSDHGGDKQAARRRASTRAAAEIGRTK